MIKNIIFDLCGPIITIDINLIDREFHRLGVKEPYPYQRLCDEGLCERFETNRISAEAFCDEVRSMLNCSLNDIQICTAWNTLITQFPQSHIDLLKKLRSRYKVFLLSNSDAINADYFGRYLNFHSYCDLMNEAFDEAFFSYELGLRKPDPKVFQHIIEKHHLLPEETLHIDDRRMHCDGARKAGLNAHLLEPDSDICNLFDTNLNLTIF